ncbi:hypothetical protein HZF05_08400 [Sphingomonas sp. CGMCC 1.13654]|jgi:hypothetical protein|uniref:Uncharacterized protein n=2 Tax=Sphingomonas TaxID=13687 RepID=A0A838L5D0_9SPHN|nr:MULTISPECIES: hypothetical protein [Sphingomonas]MBA2934120.1 hypothetical protein [Sphingomonas chungangi]MDH7640953.1 hypothetical protein [Sphingomonas oryzagri]MVW57161.1 hypothetical protein [Sphingomonas chungangi]
MVRKLEDGGFIADRDREVAPTNRIRPADPKGDERHELNKKALFRKM